MLAGVLLASSPASAFRMIQVGSTTGTVTAGSLVTCNDSGGFTHWGGTTIGFRLNTANQGSDKATALGNALQTWTNVAGAGYVLNYDGTTGNGFSTDGVNSVVWATSGACTGSCIALTALTIQSVQVIAEADILMRNDLTWTTNGGTFDSEAVLAHELGHALGIHHSEVTSFPEPTMTPTYFGPDGRTLDSDDEDALACSFDRYHSCTAAPGTPSYISGPSDLCPGDIETYWTPALTGADFYSWQIVGGVWTVSAIENHFDLPAYLLSPGTHTLRVRATNTCGNGSWQTTLVWMRDPFDPLCTSCPGRGCR